MSVSVGYWRIATITPTYSADDTSGAGAKATGGRWNSKGLPILYTSASPSLACLETLVHLKTGSLPMNRFLVHIKLPLAAWKARDVKTSKELPVGWDATPSGMVSINYGDDWLKSLASPVLMVPSAIVPEETNVLINPAHPLNEGIKATIVRKWTYDPRLLGVPVVEPKT